MNATEFFSELHKTHMVGELMPRKKTSTALEPLVLAISARALFDMEKENTIFEKYGLKAYREYQFDNEDRLLPRGTAFYLVSGLLLFNETIDQGEKKFVKVVIMSNNSPDLSLRIFKSIEHYNLDISQAVFSSGAPLNCYFSSFNIDLFLSRSETDVSAAINNGIAAAVLYSPPEDFVPEKSEIRIAFDGDAVLFSEEAEQIYKQHGLEAFIKHERQKAKQPLPAGPFAKFLKTLATLQKRREIGRQKLQLALVTARGNATHERVIRTFREWGIHIDQAFFLGGMPKDKILQEFKPHIFFDDQEVHTIPASKVAPAGKVPHSRTILDTE